MSPWSSICLLSLRWGKWQRDVVVRAAVIWFWVWVVGLSMEFIVLPLLVPVLRVWVGSSVVVVTLAIVTLRCAVVSRLLVAAGLLVVAT